jgi:hypothetical protein
MIAGIMITRYTLQRLTIASGLLISAYSTVLAQQTERQYLSGTGSDKTVNWQFYCTAGSKSGKWTTIPVPNNWELQGFGKYNYGLDKDSVRGKEQGMYKYSFTVPAAWKNKVVQIVFEGSMTDTEVKINGKSAGPVHQGAFYCFKYDISGLLQYGKKNLLEVTVSKHSANESVNGAERRGDYWIFGGIFRPVYVQALPSEHIAHVAVNGKAGGEFTAKLKLSRLSNADEVTAQLYTIGGEKTGSAFSSKIKPGDSVAMLQTSVTNPLQWTPEFPNRYRVEFTLLAKGKPVHSVQEQFGFRTVELRVRDGIYLNGVKIKFKGVNRHSFWPTTGRTMSKARSLEDVQLMKDMNMNAVRMSHYPPDDHFLDVCDSLGLMVLDELAGWHRAYDTEAGSKLVKEMIEHDVNHPSIVIWDNGNEGGSNFELDHWFHELDIQQRPLIHPWQPFGHTDTQHYINFGYGLATSMQGHEVTFPTEFLHGLYDGGLGAGLQDFWEWMWNRPLSAGGFLWVFADEAVVRRDKKDSLDADGNHGPDGILGPYHEKEGSYYTIKEVWAPVHFEPKEITPAFDGKLEVENRFHFTNLNQCHFEFRLAKNVKIDSFYKVNHKFEGRVDELRSIFKSPDIKPGEKGTLSIEISPDDTLDYQQFDVLYITANDPFMNEIYTWSWPITRPSKMAHKMVKTQGEVSVSVTEKDSLLIAAAGDMELSLNTKSGLLHEVKNANGIIPLSNGPTLCESETGFVKYRHRKEGNNVVISAEFQKKAFMTMQEWTIYPSGWVKLQVKYFIKDYEAALAGINFSFPEGVVRDVLWMGNGPYRVWKNRMKGGTLNIWRNTYNNTSTGDDQKLVYPEFKGYYSNLYWMRLNTTSQPLTVVCNNEDIFLRLFTPRFSVTPFNTAPAFPPGDLSFLHGITPIGTKSQKPEKLGPMGYKYMQYDFGKDPYYANDITLYFDFSGK